MPFGITSCKPQPGPAARVAGSRGPFARSHPLSKPAGAQHACPFLPLTQRSLTKPPEASINQSNNPRKEGRARGGCGGQREGAGAQVCCASSGPGDTSLPQAPLGLPALGAECPTLQFWPPGTPCHHGPVCVHKRGSIPLHRGAVSGLGDAGDVGQRLIQHAAAVPPRITSLGCADSTRASQCREKIPAAPARVRHGSTRWHRGLCRAVPAPARGQAWQSGEQGLLWRAVPASAASPYTPSFWRSNKLCM